jgi:uncharacterized protein YdeI (YjbR/CyaY-like superfamily)
MTKNLNEQSNTFFPNDRTAWRAWLAENSRSQSEIWLVYSKTGQSSLNYEESVLEALCFGWIDSIIQRIDDETYARKFNPRKDWNTWSESNRKRLRELARQPGQIEPEVLARIPPAVFDETVPGPPPPGQAVEAMPAWLAEQVQASPAAQQTWQRLAPSHQRRYLGWILSAKKLETQQRRATEAVQLLEQGLELNGK